MTPTSDDGELTLSAIAPCRLGLSGVARAAVRRTCHSITSNSTATPQASLRFCCKNSFIGNGDICPEPEFEINALNDNGFAGVYPASASSALPLAGSNLYRLTGFPKSGSLVLSQPAEGSAVPLSNDTSPSRSMQ